MKEEVEEVEDGQSTAGTVGIGAGENILKRSVVKIEVKEVSELSPFEYTRFNIQEDPEDNAVEQHGDAKTEQHVKVKIEELDNEGSATVSSLNKLVWSIDLKTY